MNFITLTHNFTGEKVHINVEKITCIRQKKDKTLIITGERGQYVNESEGVIFKLIGLSLDENKEEVSDGKRFISYPFK